MVGSKADEHAPAPRDHRTVMARALADGLVRALATGDTHAARVALAALAGLVDDTREGSGAAVVDLGAARRRREK